MEYIKNGITIKKDGKSKDTKKDIRKSHKNKNHISLFFSFPPCQEIMEEKRKRRGGREEERRSALSSAVLMTVRKSPTNEGREEARATMSAKERKKCEENLYFLLRCCIFVFFTEPQSGSTLAMVKCTRGVRRGRICTQRLRARIDSLWSSEDEPSWPLGSCPISTDTSEQV